MGMKRLLIVSNRLSVTVDKGKGGFRYRQSAGGLATAVASFYKDYDSLWIGWPGIISNRLDEEKRTEITRTLADEHRSAPVFLSKRDIELFYHGFSNKTLWPLFHYFPQNVVYDDRLWEHYKKVNRLFCDRVLELWRPGDTVWVHDYHLMLLPALIREAIPEAAIGFFLHIPFPSYEIFRLIPWRREILEGVMGADLVGLHTYEYARHFMSSAHRILGQEFTLGQTDRESRAVKVDIFPIGINYERFSRAHENPETKREIDKLRRKIGDRRVILSVDRLDYSKGLPQRLEAFDTFLGKYPRYRERVIMIQLTVPSREQVQDYRVLKSRVENMIGAVNGKHGTIGWTPILYLYRSLPFPELAALYHVSNIGLVTPLRDGMNLVAKEFVATRVEGRGALVLSEMAGASQELSEAVIVNPNDTTDIIEGIRRALEMDEGEQAARNEKMQRRIETYDVVHWAREFFRALEKVKELQARRAMKLITPDIEQKLVTMLRRSPHRLLFLDYGGTLAPYTPAPRPPGPAVINILSELSADDKNSLVLISGHDPDTMDRWFGDLEVGCISEHGVWLKRRDDGRWRMIGPLSDRWKRKLRPILDVYVDRTPGSFIEEKSFSLIWNFEGVTRELSDTRKRELVDETMDLVTSLELQVLEHTTFVEIKNAHVDKGRAARHWIEQEHWDTILACGNDWSDEELFAALPDDACSIKVGPTPTYARYSVRSPEDIRRFLFSLAM